MQDSDSDDDGCGHDEGLSELSSGSATVSYSPSISTRSDSLLSRLAQQFDACKLNENQGKASPRKGSGSSVVSFRSIMLGSTTAESGTSSPVLHHDGLCSGNGKNLTKIVDLPNYVPWLALYTKYEAQPQHD